MTSTFSIHTSIYPYTHTHFDILLWLSTAVSLETGIVQVLRRKRAHKGRLVIVRDDCLICH